MASFSELSRTVAGWPGWTSSISSGQILAVTSSGSPVGDDGHHGLSRGDHAADRVDGEFVDVARARSLDLQALQSVERGGALLLRLGDFLDDGLQLGRGCPTGRSFLVSAILKSVSAQLGAGACDPRFGVADLPLQAADFPLCLAQDRAAHEPLLVERPLVREIAGGLLHLAMRGRELLGKPVDLGLDLRMAFGELRQLARPRRALVVQQILLGLDARPQRLQRLARRRRAASEWRSWPSPVAPPRAVRARRRGR